MVLLLVAACRLTAARQFLTDLTQAHETLHHEQLRAAELDEEHQRLLQRMLYKRHLINRLIAGQCSLPEVVDAFERSIANQPAYLCVIRNCYPGSTDHEKIINYVLHFVQVEMRYFSYEDQQKVIKNLDHERWLLMSHNTYWQH